jgi:hypothetical protein
MCSEQSHLAESLHQTLPDLPARISDFEISRVLHQHNLLKRSSKPDQFFLAWAESLLQC